MRKLILIGGLICLSVQAFSQSKSKQHVFYDTVKTVKERVDYSPDTIPVYFKEVIVSKATNGDVIAYDKLSAGYIIWQTYIKSEPIRFSTSGYTYSGGGSDYYTDEYKDSQIRGKFLYEDKTPVKNKVVYAVRR